MHTKQYPEVIRIFAAFSLAILGALASVNTQAATISGGALTLNLDRNALIAGTNLDFFPDAPTPDFQICCRPSIYLEEFYDASAATKNFKTLRDENVPNLFDLQSDEISAIGLKFAVNASQIPDNPAGRKNKPTTFEFDPNDILGTATGKIGLNGVMRFRVDVAPPNNRVLIGDMTMEYDPTLEGTTPGRSGWRLINHIGWDDIPFELLDVTTELAGNSLTVNGNLGFGEGLDHLGSTDARLNETKIGTFSFQTTVVPVPGAVWLFASGLAGLLFGGRRPFRRIAA